MEFLKAVDEKKYCLYGGAKGGGKSYILRWALVRHLVRWAKEGHLSVRVGLFCEDYPALKDRQITKIDKEFPDWLGKLSDSQTEGMSFKIHKQFGGGVIALRNLDDSSKYSSSEFAVAAIDELTKNKREILDQFRSIVRWPKIELTGIWGATNPGQIGHLWVKKLWIDRDFGIEDPDPSQVIFVKSLPSDNPYNSFSYLEDLKKLPEKQRKAYYDGDWNIFEGQFFTEFSESVHVILPFTISETWKKFRSIDISGHHGITACLWLAVDYDGNAYAYREYYATGKDIDEHAREIVRLSCSEDYEYTVMDSSAWSKLGLPETMAELYMREGVQGLIPCSKDRVAGWAIVHSFLRYNDVLPPRMKIFNSCHNLIRTLPAMVHDDRNVDDLDTDGEDHCADALRYGLQTVRENKSVEPKKEIRWGGEEYVRARLDALYHKKNAVIKQEDYF